MSGELGVGIDFRFCGKVLPIVVVHDPKKLNAEQVKQNVSRAHRDLGNLSGFVFISSDEQFI